MQAQRQHHQPAHEARATSEAVHSRGSLPQPSSWQIEPGAARPVLQAQRLAWATSAQRTVGNRATAELLGARGGEPLPEVARAMFEPRFGRDFGQVRVHTSAAAADAARGLQARAFTVGRDIAFARGQYAPETREGRRLLAHELAHVVQQSGSPAGVQPRLEIDDASSPLEREADRAADAVLRGDDAVVSGAASLRLSRQKDAGPLDAPDGGAPDGGAPDGGAPAPAPGAPGDAGAAASCPVASTGTLSKVSWGETSGLYPTASGGASVLYDPTKWDAAKVCDILAMRQGVHTVGGRGQSVHQASPRKGDKIEQMLAKYHYTENFQPAAAITGDPAVKWFYLSNEADKPVSHPSLPGSLKVASYGSFYNNGGGDVGKGNTWVHFYKPKA